MKAIITSVLLLSLTGCATTQYTVNGQELPKHNNEQIYKTVGTIVLLGVVAGALGKQNQKSKCDNNRAGFWVDNVTGKVYTCP